MPSLSAISEYKQELRLKATDARYDQAYSCVKFPEASRRRWG